MTTWSPVGAAFNAKAHRRLNLFEKKGVGIFVCVCIGIDGMNLVFGLNIPHSLRNDKLPFKCWKKINTFLSACQNY